MITQRITEDQNLNTGTLVITAAEGNLAELHGLWEELKLRMNVSTEPSIIKLEDAPPPPMGLLDSDEIQR
jgi:hypothetical protein